MKYYNVDYFIKKFKSIPANNWCSERLYDKNKIKFCVLGHCGVKYGNSTDYVYTREAEALYGILDNVVLINDGRHDLFKEKTPKKRILAALNYVKQKRIL